MFCSNCGNQINNNQAFCPHCGAPTGAINDRPMTPAPSGNRSNQPLIIITAVIGLIIIVLLILFFTGVFSPNREKTQPSSPATETIQVVKEVQVIETPAAPAAAPASRPAYTSSNDPYAFVSTRYLTDADLAGRSRSELRIMRNAIYAHHGYKFKSADLRKYFSQFSWYVPSRSVVSPSEMSRVEQSNLSLIQSWE